MDIDRSGGINISDALLVNARRGTVLPSPPLPHDFGPAAASSVARAIEPPEDLGQTQLDVAPVVVKSSSLEVVANASTLEFSPLGSPELIPESSMVGAPLSLPENSPSPNNSTVPEIDERVCRSPTAEAHQQAFSEMGYVAPFPNQSNLRWRELYWSEPS